MKNFAQIKGDRVINIFDWNEKKDPVIKDIQHIDITSNKDKDNIRVGWIFKNDKFREPEKPTVDIEKQKEVELQELRRKAKEEILDRFLSEEGKSFAEIAEEVKAVMLSKIKK